MGGPGGLETKCCWVSAESHRNGSCAERRRCRHYESRVRDDVGGSWPHPCNGLRRPTLGAHAWNDQMRSTRNSRNTEALAPKARRSRRREAAAALNLWQALEYLAPQSPPAVKSEDCAWLLTSSTETLTCLGTIRANARSCPRGSARNVDSWFTRASSTGNSYSKWLGPRSAPPRSTFPSGRGRALSSQAFGAKTFHGC